MSNEADTCRKLVVPKLVTAGWDNEPHSIAEQRTFTDGRIVISGSKVKRKKQKKADYLLRYRRDFTLAVVEAKADYKLPGEGLQQAKDYAEILGLRGDTSQPYVCYDYSDTEHSLYPERILKGYKGILQTDGTNKFNGIIKEGATSANCWAHVHCYFEDAWKEDPVAAELPMGVIQSLFDIERVAATLSSEERLDIRQRLAKPKIDLLKEWLDQAKHSVLPKTKLGEAITYTLNRWPALLVYLDHDFVEISNNGSERSMKPVVLSRRNWLFNGSEEGGKTAATILSLIETCKRLNINPFNYMKDVLTRFPSAKTS